MARPKGGKNKRWSTEEKLRIVRRYFDERIGQGTLAKEENISADPHIHCNTKPQFSIELIWGICD